MEIKKRILEGVSKRCSVRSIAKSLNVHKSTVEYHLKRLEVLGFVKKKDHVWHLNNTKRVADKGWHTPPSFIKGLKNASDSLDIRSHAFVFTLKVPKNWVFGGFLDGGRWINGGRVFSFVFEDHKVWLCKKSIVIFSPSSVSYYSSSAEGGRSLAVEKFKSLVRGLERLLGCSLDVDGKFVFKVSKQHFANIKNGLARQYNKAKKRFYLADEGGLWLIIDNSFNLDELETVHSDSGVRDMDDVVKPFFNSLKDAPFTAYDFKYTYEFLKEYAENIKLHLATLRQMGSTMDDIGNTMKKLNGKL